MERLHESHEYRDLLDANREFRNTLLSFCVTPKPKFTRKVKRKKNFANVKISTDLHRRLKVQKGRKSFNDYINDLIRSQEDIHIVVN